MVLAQWQQQCLEDKWQHLEFAQQKGYRDLQLAVNIPSPLTLQAGPSSV
jgi:hypothetical protein